MNYSHPLLTTTAQKIIQEHKSTRKKAQALHNFVRDEIKFGFSKNFYNETAVETLKIKKGFCITKTMLFVALLHAAKIQARPVFVDITSTILDGIIDTGTSYVDHAYTEVFINDRWIKTDSYIVDKKLFLNALRKLNAENKLLGYGIHRDGSYEWDAINDSFSQYLKNDTYHSFSTKKPQLFLDTQSFYRDDKNPWNKFGFFQRLFFRVYSPVVNRRIREIREE